MTKESLTGIDKNLIFRETFNSEQVTRRNSGTPTDVTYSEGKGDFNGSTSTIPYNSISNTNFQKDFSIVCKIKPSSSGEGGFGRIIDKTDDANATNGFYLRLDTTNNRLAVRINVGGTQSSTTNSIMANIEYHIIVTITTAGTINFYVDGALTGGPSGGGTLSAVTTTNPLTVGNISGGTTTTFDGSMDFIEIYNRVLTANEVKNLYEDKYHKGIPIKTSAANQILNIDSSLGGLADRWGNAITNTSVDIVRDGDIYAQKYNGSTSKLDAGTPDTFIGDKTFIAWIKPYSFGEGPSNGRGKIIDNTQVEWSLIGDGTAMLFRRDGQEASVTGTINLNKWQFVVAVSKANGDSILYVNTVATGAEANKGTPAAGNSIIIGNNDAQDRTFDGLINAVRIYDGLLSAQEISQIYTSEKERYVK